MGICYSEQEQWQAHHKEIRQKRRNRKKKKNSSIIYQENSIYENSFASKVQDSFRQDIFQSVSHVAFESGSILTGGTSMAIGSIVEMTQQQIKILYISLSKMNHQSQPHSINEPVTLCNFKTKNFLHTHKVSHPDMPKLHEVSCCPYNSNHIIDYDTWKFIKCDYQQEECKSDSQTSESQHQDQQNYYIYHPFTQRFLNYKKGHIVCTQQKKQWKIISFGIRRKGGFVKISCQQGQLCMTDDRALLSNHRKLRISIFGSQDLDKSCDLLMQFDVLSPNKTLQFIQ